MVAIIGMGGLQPDICREFVKDEPAAGVNDNGELCSEQGLGMKCIDGVSQTLGEQSRISDLRRIDATERRYFDGDAALRHDAGAIDIGGQSGHALRRHAAQLEIAARCDLDQAVAVSSGRFRQGA